MVSSADLILKVFFRVYPLPLIFWNHELSEAIIYLTNQYE